MSRLKSQVQFLLEADRLKTVIRQNFLSDKSRRENTAEHSWHLALMAQVLHEYFPANTDLSRVTRMLIIHDLVEIIAGDTFGYDEKGLVGKEEREQQAAKQLFGMLPSEQSEEFLSLWDEFEAGETIESKSAMAIDRIQPFLLNYHTEGGSWTVHGVTRAQVEKRMKPVTTLSPAFEKLLNEMIDDSVKRGWIKE